MAAGCGAPLRGRPLRPVDLPAAAPPAIVWSADAGRGLESRPALVGNRLFVAVTDRRLQLYDAGTGARLWRKRLDGPLAVRPDPVGEAIFVASAQPDGSVYALRADNRKVVWRARIGEAVSDPVLFEGALLVVTDDGKVYGLSPADGRVIWMTNLESRVWCRPDFHPGRALLVVAARNGRLYGVDGRSGERRWMAELGPPLTGVAIGADRALVTAVDRSLFAVDLASGNRLWRRALPLTPGAAPAVSGDSLWVAGLDGRVMAMTAAQGDPLWIRDLGGPFPTPPAVTERSLVLAAGGGLVWRLDRRTGQPLGEFLHPESIRITPVPAGNVWIVMGERGRMVACRWEEEP